MFLHLCVITFPLQSAACSQAYLNEIPDLLQNDSDTPLPNPNKPQHPLTKQEAWLHIPIHGFTGFICVVRPGENLAQADLIQSPHASTLSTSEWFTDRLHLSTNR